MFMSKKIEMVMVKHLLNYTSLMECMSIVVDGKVYLWDRWNPSDVLGEENGTNYICLRDIEWFERTLDDRTILFHENGEEHSLTFVEKRTIGGLLNELLKND